jgi:hypothetical protein
LSPIAPNSIGQMRVEISVVTVSGVSEPGAVVQTLRSGVIWILSETVLPSTSIRAPADALSPNAWPSSLAST